MQWVHIIAIMTEELLASAYKSIMKHTAEHSDIKFVSPVARATNSKGFKRNPFSFIFRLLPICYQKQLF